MKVGKLYKIIRPYPFGEALLHHDDGMYGLDKGLKVFVFCKTYQRHNLPGLRNIWNVDLLVDGDRKVTIGCSTRTWDLCFERIL